MLVDAVERELLIFPRSCAVGSFEACSGGRVWCVRGLKIAHLPIAEVVHGWDETDVPLQLSCRYLIWLVLGANSNKASSLTL